MAGVLASLRRPKTDATEDSYSDVKPPNSLILEDSPYNSPYNSPDNTDLSLQCAEMSSTPIEKLKHHIPSDTIAVSPIIPNLEFDESDDSPTGSQDGLDELGASIDG